VYVKGDGNVGIGTTSPLSKLHIDGIVRTEVYYNVKGNDVYFGSGSGLLYSGSANDAVVRSSNNVHLAIGGYTALTVNGSSNVGIGTTSPAQMLHVTGNGLFNGNLDVGQGVSTQDSAINVGAGRTGSGYAYIDLIGDTTYTDYALRIIRNNSGANASSQIIHRGTGNFSISTNEAANLTFGTSASERMRITSAGNVGIGTTNPSYRLSVYTSTDYGNNSEYANAIIGLGNAAYPVSIRSYRYGGSYLNGLDLYYNDGTSKLGLRLDSSGNVGIGTTSPAAKLEVVGDAKFGGTSNYNSITINNNSNTGGGGILLQRNGVNNAYIGALGWYQGTSNSGAVIGTDNSSYPIVFYTNVERMRITGGGNVGIGTDSPSQNLHVTGNVRVTGAYYDSNNEAGTSGQVLTSTGSGTDWVTPATTTASSLYDLLPAARVAYDWTVQMTSGTWADIFSSNTVLSNGTWMVQVYVSDFASGGQQYQETYSGVMSWGNAASTNQGGASAISEVVLHRSGHAANAGQFYLRTQERAGSTLLLQGMVNYSHTSNTTINFKFVKVF
jgi:hypothetical protein